MPPKPIRSDCTPEILRLIAERALSERIRNKYLLLAGLQDGSIVLVDLLPEEKKTALRYIREINDEPSIERLLSPEKGGPKPVVRTDISPASMREKAKGASGKLRNGLLTFAEVVEKGSLEAGAALGLITLEHIQRLLPLFNEYGVEGLDQLKLTAEDAAVAEAALKDDLSQEDRLKFEALAAAYREGLTLTEVKKRFGIEAGTFDGHVRKLKLHGRLAFAGRTSRKASQVVDEAAARIVLEVARVAIDDVTRKRCLVVGGVLAGEDRKALEERYRFTPATVTRLIKAFKTHGVAALLGEREFVTPADKLEVRRLRDSLHEGLPDEAAALGAADYYEGSTFKEIEDRRSVERVDVFGVLYAIQRAEFVDPVAAARTYLSGRAGGGGAGGN